MTSKRQLLFIGEMPGHPGEWEAFPAQFVALKRLASLAGMEPTAFKGRFVFYNLMTHGAWSVTLAKRAAEHIIREFEGGWWPNTRIVLLGRRVTEAFRAGTHNKAPYFREVVLTMGVVGLVLPHPSGRNRMWNFPMVTRRAERALRRWIRWAQA